MKLSRQTWTLSIAGVLAGLCSCGGGGGGAAPVKPFGNLQATSLQVTSDNPATAHEMELSTGIFASDPIDAVPVSYFLMNKADVDDQLDDVRQHFVGSSVFENVSAGQKTYESVVTIPKDVSPAGDYYLIVQVDPDNVIPETDEDDNMPTESSKIVLNIDGSKWHLSDLVIEDVSIDTEALILYDADNYGNIGVLEDVVNHDFGATLLLTTTGANEAKNLDLSATITFPGNQRNPFSLWFWDSEKAEYSDRFFTSVTPGIPNTVHLDVFIPVNNSARREIDQYLRNGGKEKFTVTFSSNMLGNVAEWDGGSDRWEDRDENKFTLQMVIVRPPEPPADEIHWERALRKDWRNDAFSLGLSLRGAASLDERGAIATGEAGLPVTLFGKKSELLGFDAHARVKPQHNQPTDSEFGLDLSVLGQTVYTRSSVNPRYTYSDDWNITRTAQAKSTIFVGPIPVVVTAGATGAVGFRANAFLDPALMRLSAGPYANATAFAEAAVEAIVAKVGVRGSLTLISDEFTAAAQADLSQPEPTKLLGELSFDIVNELQGPKGRLWLFADRRVPKWCYKVVPCGIKTVTDEKTLVSFSSFHKKDVLFRSVRTALVDL